MSDEDYRDDDKRFYKNTAYNEAYYIERENDLIRQSNLELDHDFEDAEETLQQEVKARMPESLDIDYSLEVF